MSARDEKFVSTLGVPVSRISDVISKSRQTVARSLRSDRHDFSGLEIVQICSIFDGDGPEAKRFCRELAKSLYPEYRDLLATEDERKVASFEVADFVLSGEYWFICRDFVHFLGNYEECVRQLRVICDAPTCIVVVFCNSLDIKSATRFAFRSTKSGRYVVKCEAEQTRLLPPTLVYRALDGVTRMFIASSAGFMAGAEFDAASIRALFDEIREHSEITTPQEVLSG